MISCKRVILLLFEFKPNLTNKNISKNIMNQAFNEFVSNEDLNITHMNSNFKRHEFEHATIELFSFHYSIIFITYDHSLQLYLVRSDSKHNK